MFLRVLCREHARLVWAQLTHLMETISFCRLMHYRKIGIAYCSGCCAKAGIVNRCSKKGLL